VNTVVTRPDTISRPLLAALIAAAIGVSYAVVSARWTR
jgi:hypothetical protein